MLNAIVQIRYPRGKIIPRLCTELSKVLWSDDYRYILNSDTAYKHKEFFDSFITHGQTADGNILSVNENVSPEFSPAIKLRMFQIECIRIVQFYGEMIAAIRVKALYFINAFWHLQVAFAHLWPRFPTGPLYLVSLNGRPGTAAMSPKFQAFLSFEGNHSNSGWRICYSRSLKEMKHPALCRRPIQRDNIPD